MKPNDHTPTVDLPAQILYGAQVQPQAKTVRVTSRMYLLVTIQAPIRMRAGAPLEWYKRTIEAGGETPLECLISAHDWLKERIAAGAYLLCGETEIIKVQNNTKLPALIILHIPKGDK